MYERWENIFIEQFGSKVINYRVGKGWRDHTLISGDLALVMTMLNSIVLSERKDEIIWGDNPNGLYLVGSGYNSLWKFKQKPPQAEAWI